MLTGFTLSNFKPFAGTHHIPLAPITLIYGPNSGGKSSILQSLALLKQSKETSLPSSFSLRPRGTRVDLGSLEAMAHRHNPENGFQFGFEVPADMQSATSSPHDARLRTTIHLSGTSPDAPASERGKISAARYEVITSTGERLFDTHFDLIGAGDHDNFAWRSLGDVKSLVHYVLQQFRYHQWNVPNKRDGRLTHTYGMSLAPMFSYDETHGEPWEDEEHDLRMSFRLDPFLDPARFSELVQLLEPSAIHSAASLLPYLIVRPSNRDPVFPPKESGLRTKFGNFLRDTDENDKELLKVFSNMLGHFAWVWPAAVDFITYLGPLRVQPDRYYVPGGPHEANVGHSGEHTPQILAENRGTVLREIDRWFSAFDIAYTLQVRDHRDPVLGDLVAIVMTDKRTGTAVGPADVGFGIGQLLPVLVEGTVSVGRMICVEQPEIHLHPRLQANLADFFIETAGVLEEGERLIEDPNQWVIETHSEAMMLRIQRRIREGKLKPENVKVLYVEPGAEGSEVLELRLDEDGEFIDEWPGGFFEESFEELFGAGEAD